MKQKITTALILLFVLGVSLFFIIPEWIHTAKITDLKKWYPSTASFVYYFIILIPLFLAIIVVCIISLWRKEISSFNYREYKQIFFYTLILILLIAQYYYNYTNDEVYPAIMMPAFANGKYNSPIINIENEIILLHCNGKTDTTNFYELTLSVLGDEESKLIASNKIVHSSVSPMLESYLYQIIKTLPKENCIKELTLLKVINEYLYDEIEFNLKDTKKESLYKIVH